jgi:hypothetical protein
VEAYTSLLSLGLDTTAVRVPSLVCPEPVRQNVFVACSKCCLYVSLLAPMLRPGEAVQQQDNGGQSGDGEGACGPGAA